MKTFGLIGYRLGHSFSKKFFTEKFNHEKLMEHEYLNFELNKIEEFPSLFEKKPTITGLNCTIPYKQQIIQYLNETDHEAAEIGAVNTIKINRDNNGRLKLIGYNTDAYGFENSLKPMLSSKHKKALILGTGGASKAIKYVLTKLGIDYISATTKNKLQEKELTYAAINEPIIQEHRIIINATPLGTFPNIDTCAELPYQFITENHILYDLVYNPAETLFLHKGKEHGATIKNGLEMLHLQALRAWEIWNR